jgi:histidine triad (HIT) family protein
VSDCIFCKIAKKEIPSNIVYEDDRVIAFKDVNPQAPVHILIIPKIHLTSLMDINEENSDLVSHIAIVTKKIAAEYNIDQKGFRLVNNCGKEGGQTVFHLHFHLLGGRMMTWPPG